MNKELKILRKGKFAQVYTPYNKDFVVEMQGLQGTWNRLDLCWWVHYSKIGAVRVAMRKVFGTDDISGSDTLSLKLIFSEQKGAFRSDYTLFGKTLSHATSLTSGGTAGADVRYLEKKPESGGSVKNWCSVVPAGSIIVLEDVSRDVLESTTVPDGITIEYLITTPQIPDRAALLQEREQLAKRLEEIDRLLEEP